MNWARVKISIDRLILGQQGVAIPFINLDDGSTLWGARTMLRREDYNADAGLVDAYSFSLLTPASQFIGRALPKPRQSKVMVDGVEYRVLAVEQDAAGATYRIHLGEALA